MLSEAVRVSREAWMSVPKIESADAFQCDDGTVVDPATNTVLEVAGQPLDDDKQYHVACDIYDLRRNPVLLAHCTKDPSCTPPEDAGRPILPILVEQFCLLLWQKICDCNHDGTVDDKEIDNFFAKYTNTI